MTEYALYLESGPRRRKTMVHVLDLLGCVAQGPTTEAALDATAPAIQAYLRFLQRHGEAAHPEAPFTTAIALHVMEGVWLGNGDPTPGFPPDFAPLPADEMRLHLRRLAWLQDELLCRIVDLSPAHLVARPEAVRTIEAILQHAGEAHCAYLRYTLAAVEGLPAVLRDLFRIANVRCAAMTEEDLSRRVPHGQVTWTARRGLRRMLEHTWEHSCEIAGRLGSSNG